MDYLKKIEENRELQIQTLQDLVSIKSVQSNPVATKDGEVYPFGKGVQDAFAYTLNKGKELGFEIKTWTITGVILTMASEMKSWVY